MLSFRITTRRINAEKLMERHRNSAGKPVESEPSLQTLRHELRTPVNHIIGYSEMLLDEAGDLDAPERFAALREIVATGHVVLGLINECLAGPEADKHLLDLEPLHAQLAPHLAAVVQHCDELDKTAVAGGLVSFSSDLAKIADAASQLNALSSGEALLALAEDALPAQPPPQLNVPPGMTSINDYQTGTLLLVDDNLLNRDMLSRWLKRLGYHVEQAEGGQQALDMLRAQPFDLMLLDIMMPEMDGYSVLAVLKDDPELSRVPVIVLSALDDTDSVVRAVELGADDYLPKPFDPVLLKARIGASLFKKRLRDMEVDYLKRIEQQKRRADDLLHVVIPIGVALSVEKDFNQLLERIVQEAQALCNADGGTLYLRTEDHKLRFVIVRNQSLNIAMGGASGKDIPFPPLRLYDEQSGNPLYNYVVTHAALDGTTINIEDAYNAEGYDFSGTRDFDARTGYRSTSILNIPLKDGLGRIIGVLQLINAQNEHGQTVPFDPVAEQMLESLGALAAAALAAYSREQQLRQEIAELRIEIDQVKQQQEVAQITNTAYFSQLQERARQLRQSSTTSSEDEPAPAPAKRVSSDSPERRSYVVDGQELVVREQGPARGRLLLLIHGWSSSWYALSPLMNALSDRFRCVAVDLPGYGESPPLPQRAAIPRYAELLVGLIRQLSGGLPAILVGHSMGGMISLNMALQSPELIERMVLLCPTISGNLSTSINLFISPITMLERFKVAGNVVAALEPYMLSMTDRLMKPVSFAERTGISEKDYHRLRADARRPGQGRVRAECFWAMRDNDLSGKLSRIQVPALVIWGMEDNTVPLRDASIVADEWTSAELRVLPKAGHWPQFETPDVTRRYVRSFLSTPIKLLKAQF